MNLNGRCTNLNLVVRLRRRKGWGRWFLLVFFSFFGGRLIFFSVEGAEYRTCWFATVNQITILKHPMIWSLIIDQFSNLCKGNGERGPWETSQGDWRSSEKGESGTCNIMHIMHSRSDMIAKYCITDSLLTCWIGKYRYHTKSKYSIHGIALS